MPSDCFDVHLIIVAVGPYFGDCNQDSVDTTLRFPVQMKAVFGGLSCDIFDNCDLYP